MINMLVGLRDWVDARLPIIRAWDTHMGKYYAPKNFNFWYVFGFLSLVLLVNQLLTGIWLDSALYAFHGCVRVFCGGLSAHVPRPAVRVLSEAA